MIDYSLEHIFSFTVTVLPPEIIGPVPEGLRFNWYIKSGEVHGPKVQGKIRPAGGDWQVVRHDGVALIDVRTTIETSNQALIYLSYTGMVDLGEDGYQKIVQRAPLPSGLPLRTSLRFATAHPDYCWLNRLQCIGIGQTFMERLEVAYDVYAIR